MSELTWESILAIEGHPTSDRRYLIPGELAERELPMSLMVMTVNSENGHEGSELGGKITEILRMSAEEALERDLISEQAVAELTEGAIMAVGRGVFDHESEVGVEAARLVDGEFLTGVSIDLAIEEVVLLDPESFEEVDVEDLTLEDMLLGDFLSGIKGSIMGATVVPFPAFEETSIRMVYVVKDEEVQDAEAVVVVASGMRMTMQHARPLLASGGPLKPPRSWFENPNLSALTPLTISKDGQVYGHLADWSGCHTGFTSVCVPPFRSVADYAYFNTGEIETGEGALVPCGKIMFCRDGGGHAPLDPKLAWQEITKYYDDATKVGAYVRAGSDRFGTWLAGVLRHDLSDEEVQHLRLHPPSGDWRPIPGKGTELVAAFSVPIPGFPIPRSLAASGADGELTLITGPLIVGPVGARAFRRRKKMLRDRAYAVLERAVAEPLDDD